MPDVNMATPSVEFTLFLAWLWRGLFIFGAGAVPFYTGKLFPDVTRTKAYREAKSFCSLVGLLMCLFALPLWLDTFKYETKGEDSLEEATCLVASIPAHFWQSLTCAQGDTYELESPLAIEEGTTYRLTYLPTSKLIVRAQTVTP